MADQAKEAVREQVRRRVSALTAAERAAKSEVACRALLQLPEVRSAQTVLLYMPLPDEVDVRPVLREFKKTGRRTLLPKCLTARRELLCIEVADFEHNLVPGVLGILQPKANCGVDPGEVDLFVVPGRAYDRSGNRLGRGAGYYDRFFAGISPCAFKCGVGFDCQVFAAVPAGPLDIPVDAVVTESGIIRAAASCA